MTMTHHALLALLWTILGSCLGSFLNVCLYRLPRRMSVFRPRSRCPHCGTAIQARHNVPVLGWLIVRGRCRECRCAISPRYPAVELAVGLLFALPYLVAVTLDAGDPWERFGSARLLGILLASWMATGLSIYMVISRSEARWSFSVLPEAGRRPGGAGGEGPASSVLRSRADRN
jgi:prepilin signal peptidase PulO-like enzyme (type II secretory pathway)